MKTCLKCKETKELDAFNKATAARYKDGRQDICRSCSKAYYQGNKIKHRANVKARNTRVRREVRQFLLNYLNSHPCIDCGETDPVVLEFDHVRDTKAANIGKMAGNCSIEQIKEELKKCEVRCANCHRRRTAKQFNWYTNLAAVG